MTNFKKIYLNQGYLYKFKAINKDLAQKIQNDFFKNLKNKHNFLINEELKYRPHMIFKSFHDLVENKNIIKIVKSILGDKIVLWNSLIFYKKKNNYVSFHQDLKYWKFKNDKCLTVSLALTKSNIENGCLKVIPRSHNQKFKHKRKFRDRNNLLGSNQSVKLKKNFKSFPLILNPGEFSVHHGNILHGSDPNTSLEPRVLFAMRYAAYDNPSSIYKYANFLFNDDEKKYFIPLPSCKKNYDPKILKFREKLLKDAASLQLELKTGIFFKLLKYINFIFVNKLSRQIIYLFLK